MAAEKEKLAVFMYFDADDLLLENSITRNVLAMTWAKLSDNIEIYVYLDRMGQDTRTEKKDGFDDVYTDWLKDGKPQPGSMYGKLVKQQDGSFKVEWDTTTGLEIRDSSLNTTLQKFLEWGTNQTDAKHYVVWMSDHGFGVWGGFSDGAIENKMMPKQYAEVLKTYSDKLKLIVFDACLMANAEALGELVGIADYVVASEETISNEGLDYERTFNAFSALSSLDSNAMAEAVIEANSVEGTISAACTLSAISLDTELYETFSLALQNFGAASRNFTGADWNAVIDAFSKEHYYYDPSYYNQYADLISILGDSALTGDNLSNTLKNAAAELKDAAQNLVLCRKENGKQGYGLTILAPVAHYSEKHLYEDFSYMGQLSAGNDTAWTDFLYQLNLKAVSADKAQRNVKTETTKFYVTISGTFPMESGYYELINNEQIPLTGGMIYSNNYVTNREVWMTFHYDPEKFSDGDTYSLNFSFSPYYAEGDDSQWELEDGDVTIEVYESAITEKGVVEVNDQKRIASFANEGNSISISIDGDQYRKGLYTLQILSEKMVQFSLEGDHKNAGKAISATEDRFDAAYYYQSDTQTVIFSNHSQDGAIKILSEVKTLVASNSVYDWFQFMGNMENGSVQVIASGNSKGTALTSNDVLTVTLKRWDEKQKIITQEISATGVLKDGVVTYTFDAGVEIKGGDYLTVTSTLSDASCHYSIKAKWSGGVPKPEPEPTTDYYEKGYIDATSVLEIPGKAGSFSLKWSNAHLSASTTQKINSYYLQLSKDGFNSATNLKVYDSAAKIYNVEGTVEWKVGAVIDNAAAPAGTTDGETVTGTLSAVPECVSAQNDYISDIMLARADGTWQSGYVARNRGFAGTDWTGTREAVSITGKNKITDVFTGGGSDSAILVLTDDANGDAAFVDDIYSALPDDMTAGSRLTNITTVYAGAGDDVVDFTSQRYSCADNQKFEKMILYGGDGNDVLWTANTASWLFGDAGNDKLSGSTKNDTLVGGSGDDILYGCGGEEDIFCFCENWGNDTVYQEADSKVVLWFAKGKEENWDADTLTYSDGDNSVKVSGVTNDDITFRFGREQKYADEYDKLAEAGAFLAQTTSKIYESTLA